MKKFILHIELITKDEESDISMGDACDHMRRFIKKMNKDTSNVFNVVLKEITMKCKDK